MKILHSLFLSCFFLTGLCFSDITVTYPSSRVDVKSCSDYAYEVLGDPWDMNQRTDLGWRIFNTVELPKSYLKNISFQNGIFSAKSESTSLPGVPADFSDVNIFLLDSGYPGSAFLGKIGTNFPIDANKYTVLALRMYLGPSILEGNVGQLLWSKNSIYRRRIT